MTGRVIPRLGVHVSVAGGLVNGLIRGAELGCEAIQIFTKNQRRWNHPPLAEDTAEEFRAAFPKYGSPPIASHGAYLLNLAAAENEVAEKTMANLTDELERCRMLRVPYLVLHPGSHGGAGVETGVKRIAKNIGEALSRSGNEVTTVLLETTSGAGKSVGGEFSHLRDIIAASPMPERLGVCVDTCHIFAAGYELKTREGYEETVEKLSRIVTLERVNFFHLNDSLGELGSKKDRHTHIGKGELGLAPFGFLMNDPRFYEVPMVLETPDGDNGEMDAINLATLRSLKA
ncbi:MAG: deoxyribonuclease IV [Deltaproteobacteria bacterium]|nr:MAG: deoxyribonuclease IV [Deltaproteobacteria bacterium]